MASSSRQLQATTLLLVAALLFLVCTTTGQAARSEPGSKDHMPQVSSYPFLAVSATVIGDEKSGSVTGMEMHHEEPEATQECEGEDEGGEECLMRRTLVAHTDYIYTQEKHN
ncbi:hypothetical protein HU200_025340 [Digitaria exilis]|uniref:Phytosulfokine n=1 Tax=Digitaria exilis TaxID=1010633 RepID=A0A835C2X9_9POAL|nr:hypothetical protein HU200_025340 [Digitaria exilis]